MRPFGVVPLDPSSNCGACFREGLEVALPHTLLLEATKEALDNAVLFGRIGSDEFLPQAIIAAGGPKAPALENQPVIAANHRGRTIRTQSAKARQAGLLKRALGFLRTAAQSELKTGDFAVVAIDYCSQVTPTISSARDVSYVHRPALGGKSAASDST